MEYSQTYPYFATNFPKGRAIEIDENMFKVVKMQAEQLRIAESMKRRGILC